MWTSFFTIFVAFCIAGGMTIEWKTLKSTMRQYHDIPLSLGGLMQSNHYSLMVQDEDLKLGFYCFKNDPRVAVGLDSYGNIGGLRFSYIKSDLPARGNAKNLTFPYAFYNKTFYTSGTFLNTDVWYVDVLFVHPDTLKTGGRQETGGLVGEDVFIKINGEWITLARNECKARPIGFILQGCVPVMGLHYFYDIKTDSDCVGLQPVFAMYENAELVGFGLSTLGVQTAAPDRTWFEDTPRDVFKIITPNRPDCLLPLLDNFGVTAIHIFFKENPLSTSCA